MRSKEDIEYLAYDIWHSLTENSPKAFLLSIMGGGSMLALLLWILGREDDFNNKDLLIAIERGKKNIADDCIEDPIGMIVRDIKSRREARDKIESAQDN